MSLRFLILPLLLLASAVANATGGDSNDALLRSLDHTISEKETYTNERRAKISESLTHLAEAKSDKDLYNVYRTLFDLYRSFRSDSALWVAERRLEIAKNMGDTSKIISATINLADCYSKAADYHSSIEMLDRLSRADLAKYHRKYMYQVYAANYRRMAKSDGVLSRRLKFEDLSRAYNDSVLDMCDPASTEYAYLRAMKLMNAGQWKTAETAMKKLESRPEFANDAGFKTHLATIYHNLNNRDLEVKYLAEASILDLKNGICDYVALINLAAHLNEEGDYKRAYTYIRCALDDASACNVKSRTSEILEMMPIIDATYNEREAAASRQTRNILIIVAILGAALAVALWLALRQIKISHRYRNELNENNMQLSQLNAELKSANRAREKFISQLFDVHSSYLSRTNQFRKNARRLLKAGQYDKVLDLVSADYNGSAELKELYARFDYVFLSLYPKFIMTYNNMVREEYRVDPASTTLTSELRVVALIKIGITENSRIAELLHYTTQTVYNYKSAIYNSLAVTKDEFREFLEGNNLID